MDAFFIGVFDSDASARDYASQLANPLKTVCRTSVNGSYISLLRECEEIAQFFLSTTH